MNAPRHLVEQFLNRHSSLFKARKGYLVFVRAIIGSTGIEDMPSRLTEDNVEQWNKHLTEWEALAEVERCQYDVLAALAEA